MDEGVFNRIIKDNINDQNNWAFKISDSSSPLQMSPNCFDGFGYTKNFGINWESKLIKNDFAAFNFSKIRNHQLTNLFKIKDITKNWEVKILCLILVGVWIPYKGIYLFLFDVNYISNLIKKCKKSILKREFLYFIEKEKFIFISKGIFDVSSIVSKIIYDE